MILAKSISKNSIWALAALGFLFSTPAIAQVHVQATVDTNRILIGEQIKLTLSATYPESVQIAWPELWDKIDDFEIIKSTEREPLPENENVTSSKEYVITSFDSGFYVIRPLVFKLLDPAKGISDSLETLPILIQVTTVEVDTNAEIKPIKDPLAVGVSFWEWAPYVMIPLVLLLLAAIIWYLYKTRNPEIEQPEEVKLTIPAHVIALEKLYALEQKELWQNGQVKLFHIEVSDIVREYIELAFGVPALESTTDEIIYGFRRIPVSGSLVESLKELLHNADMVKFAKMKPDAEINQRSFDQAMNFVNATSKKGDTE